MPNGRGSPGLGRSPPARSASSGRQSPRPGPPREAPSRPGRPPHSRLSPSDEAVHGSRHLRGREVRGAALHAGPVLPIAGGGAAATERKSSREQRGRPAAGRRAARPISPAPPLPWHRWAGCAGSLWRRWTRRAVIVRALIVRGASPLLAQANKPTQLPAAASHQHEGTSQVGRRA